MKRRIALLLALVMLVVSLPVSVSADLGVGTIHGGWLRLRSAPNTLSSVLGRYYTGAKVTVHSATGSWYYVTAPDGKVGYMSRNFITLNGGGGGGSVVPPGGFVPSGESGYVTSPNGRGVRLRSTPYAADSSNVIGLYSVGTKLTVLQKGSGWHYIQIGSQTGYMLAQYIVIGGTPVPPSPGPIPPGPGYTAYVTSQNGKGVRMRTGPGTNYSILGTYPVGTQVTVLNNLGAWCYIRIASKTGYMMTTFLTEYGPVPIITPTPTPFIPVGTIADAQITIQDPIKGDRLYVYVTPDGADYLVQWFNDLGQLLGTGDGYPVKQSDLGRRIRARVTGRNGWAGLIETPYTDVIGGSGAPTPVPSMPLTGQVFLPVDVHVNDTLVPYVSGCNASALVFTWYVGGGKYAQQGSLKITAAMAGQSVQVVATAVGYTGSLTAVTQVAAAPTPVPTPGPVEFITPVPKGGSLPEAVAPVTPPDSGSDPVVEVITPETPVTPPDSGSDPVVEVIKPATPPDSGSDPVVEVVTPAAPPTGGSGAELIVPSSAETEP